MNYVNLQDVKDFQLTKGRPRAGSSPRYSAATYELGKVEEYLRYGIGIKILVTERAVVPNPP